MTRWQDFREASISTDNLKKIIDTVTMESWSIDTYDRLITALASEGYTIIQETIEKGSNTDRIKAKLRSYFIKMSEDSGCSDEYFDAQVDAAFDAIAPLLIAQGLREATKIYAKPGEWLFHAGVYNAILARADELEGRS